MTNPATEPATELIDSVTPHDSAPVDHKGHPSKPKPPREISQAAIASFFYGTLQLLVTSIGAVLVTIYQQSMKAFQSSYSPDLTGLTGTGGTDAATQLAEMQEMLEELGITDPSAPPIDPTAIPAPDIPTAVPDSSTIPGIPTGIGLPDASNSQIVPMEFLAIIITHGFGLLALITAFIAFGAVTKGKSGRGLAITGLVSGFLSFSIAFMVALEM